ILQLFSKVPEYYAYSFPDFVFAINDQVKSFKLYKKLKVSQSLVEKGLLNPSLWSINVYNLSTEGQKYRYRLIKKSTQVRGNLESIKDSREIMQIPDHFILTPVFRKELNRLKQIVKEQEVEIPDDCSLKPFLTEHFLINQFIDKLDEINKIEKVED
ncbi:MAG: hypothetical protein AAFX87_06605, partial [Bacteroidota bacterium]